MSQDKEVIDTIVVVLVGLKMPTYVLQLQGRPAVIPEHTSDSLHRAFANYMLALGPQDYAKEPRVNVVNVNLRDEIVVAMGVLSFKSDLTLHQLQEKLKKKRLDAKVLLEIGQA